MEFSKNLTTAEGCLGVSGTKFLKDYSMCEAHLVFFESFAFEKKLKFTKEKTNARCSEAASYDVCFLYIYLNFLIHT